MTTMWAAGNVISSSSDLLYLSWDGALYSGDVLGLDVTATMIEMRRSFTVDGAAGSLVAHRRPDSPALRPRRDGDLPGSSSLQPGRGRGRRAQRRARCWQPVVLVAHHPKSGATLVIHANIGEVDLRSFVPALAAGIAHERQRYHTHRETTGPPRSAGVICLSTSLRSIRPASRSPVRLWASRRGEAPEAGLRRGSARNSAPR